jgi:L-glyceraldehyde 3-phosphate reductase
MGAIAFTALAQGLLTDRYAIADAADINRATHRPTLSSSTITGDVLAKLRGLKAIADGRGQSLAQMALAWVLRDPLVASTLIGASSVAQLDENLGALANLDFSGAELAAIDEYATDANINVWQASSEL